MNESNYVTKVLTLRRPNYLHEIYVYEARNTEQLLNLFSDLARRPIRLKEIQLPEVQDGLKGGKMAVFVSSQKDWMIGIPEEPFDEHGVFQINAIRNNRPESTACLRVVDDMPLKYKLNIEDNFLSSQPEIAASPLQTLRPMGLLQ
jgi:hypothetical protein